MDENLHMMAFIRQTHLCTLLMAFVRISQGKKKRGLIGKQGTLYTEQAELILVQIFFFSIFSGEMLTL
jgi:hypothetical protein